MSPGSPSMQNEPSPTTPTRAPARAITRADYDRYLPLVRRAAMHMARRVPAHVGVDELVGYGWLGMVEALSRAKGEASPEQFEAYAMHRVRGAMLDYLRSLDPQKRKLRNASKRVARSISRLIGTHGRPPTEDEIAADLGIDIEEYRELLGQMHTAGMARLEMLDIDEVEARDERMMPDEEAGRRMLSSVIADGIERLPDRLRQILSLYYEHDCTLREIGAIFGVSESRICQLHTEAMHRLRAHVGRE
jgi:RNA polymerase sigma factor for flagellar operon FliA